MSIRWKIILIVVPLILATLLLTGVSSYFSASNGITRLARDFLGFKAQELQTQAQSQWRLLVDNNLTGSPEMVSATKAAVEGYARSIVRSATELIVAVGADGGLLMSTSEVSLDAGEQGALAEAAGQRRTELMTVSLGGKARVAQGFWFEPFGWYLVVSEERQAFYAQVTEIAVRTAIILVAAIVAGVGLVLGFAAYLTRPLKRVVGTMREIISTNDLSKRVVVEYHDEIGQLAQTFNLMVDGLEKAYRDIKGFALKAAVARTREQKIKDVFERYVPPEIIEEVVKAQGKIQAREDDLCVMFSHITNFSELTARFPRPDELVQSLEPYFRAMVDAIMDADGMVDKFITDAVMAFFGAPVKHDDDPLRSVRTGIAMTEALDRFNRQQLTAGRQPFAVSVGINYGKVTVGTMGTEDKMNYTVIGDAVNLASRLSGLAKVYRQPVILSESLRDLVKEDFPCRLLDSVAVKGRTKGVKIFTARRALTPRQREGWGLHELGMSRYYARDFARAAIHFNDALKALPGDPVAAMFVERTRKYRLNPPPAEWDGVEVMTHK